MDLGLSLLYSPKIKALVTGAFLLGGVIFSLLTYFMIVSGRSQPLEITYTCGSALGAESGVPVNNISIPSSESPLSSESSGLVNINTASEAQLDTLPGIGPSIAKGIIEYRETNGAFTSIEEIMRVTNIGRAKFDGMKDLITTK
ncbi:helix-hairpin-helix domain-containing protein [Candidatus Parcubacteria bacterium]|nr:helix-hairpin-helix domain-containing protein [Patescibacteria group bacterium]MBU4380990.1 helix-hairpin-helix domain-containing protein [Patescibacteria group bacterium]MCG2689302.1 helix-hairpin-helix domain-containing protein [Candidatus Parcubacteria bacterium]